MGVLERIKQIFTGSQTKQVDGVNAEDQLSDFVLRLFGFSEPPDRTAREKVDAFHGTPSVYLVQHRVSDAFASVDWTVKVDGEPTDDHPLVEVARRPNERHSGWTYRYLQSAYRDLLGESFAEIEPVEGAEDPRPFLLRPLPPFDVTLKKGRKGGADTIFADVTMGAGHRQIPFERLVWSTKPNLTDPYGRGRGIGDVIGAEMEIDEFASEYVRSFFHNDATPRGVLSTDVELNDDQHDRMKKRFEQRHRGASRSHRTALLSGTGVSYERLSDKFEHLNIAELRQFEIDLIRKVYGVPPEIVGQTEDSNRAKARAARDHMARYTTLPRLRFHREEWARQILPRFEDGDSLELVPDDPIPANLEHRRELLSDHKGAFTINEIREEAGFEPREDGDQYLREPTVAPQEAGEVKGVSAQTVEADVETLPDLTERVERIRSRPDPDTVQFPIEVSDGQESA